MKRSNGVSGPTRKRAVKKMHFQQEQKENSFFRDQAKSNDNKNTFYWVGFSFFCLGESHSEGLN